MKVASQLPAPFFLSLTDVAKLIPAPCIVITMWVLAAGRRAPEVLEEREQASFFCMALITLTSLSRSQHRSYTSSLLFPHFAHLVVAYSAAFPLHAKAR